MMSDHLEMISDELTSRRIFCVEVGHFFEGRQADTILQYVDLRRVAPRS